MPVELPVVGDFADDVSRPLTAPSSGTSYQSSNDKVIQVLPDGMLKIVGNGKTVLTVKNRGKEASLDVHVAVGDEPNEPPVAVAGADRTVKSGAKVELNGLGSHDPEGEALFYAWSQVRGAKVPLLDLNMPGSSWRTVVQAIRSAYPATRVVAFTGGVTARDNSVDGWLAKPAQPEAIIDAINHAILR